MATPERILQILPHTGIGSGVANTVLSWHRNIDRSNIQFDYLLCIKQKDNFDAEIEALGGRIYYLPQPSLLTPWRFINAARKFFKTHKYKIIHSHLTQLNFFYFPMARRAGVKNIILHSHSALYSVNKVKALVNRLMLWPVRPLITEKVACSALAGKGLFGEGNSFNLIPNAIDADKYAFNQKKRDAVRAELRLKDKFVIGHIGRFNKEKNHTFLLDVFKAVHNTNSDAALMLVGDGPLFAEIKAKAAALGLSQAVYFLGARSDTAALYSAMDVFVLPSLFEGLPVCALEAQAAGLPCIISDTITRESGGSYAEFISLSNKGRWAEEMLLQSKQNDRQKIVDEALLCTFDIKSTVRKLSEEYFKKL